MFVDIESCTSSQGSIKFKSNVIDYEADPEVPVISKVSVCIPKIRKSADVNAKSPLTESNVAVVLPPM